MRDVAPEQAFHSVRELGLSPWTVELIVDLALPSELLVELFSNQNLDPKHPIDSALLLWASEFSSPVSS